ncbi:MAG: hypothetical protein NVSMB57_06860 [Actinomycetota bacterium]
MSEPELQRVAQAPLPPWLASIERVSGLTPSGLAVAGSAVLGWLTAYFIGSRVLFLMVYGLAGLLIALRLTGGRRLGIVAERSDLPTRVREGQSVDVALTIQGKGRTGTLILEETLERLAPSVRMLVASLPSGTPVEHTYSFRPKLRGVYGIGPLVAVSSDPFGLTRKRHVLIPPAQVIVHPSTESVHDRVLSREWEDPPVRPPISKPWPTGFEFYGMRDYVAGDDPRRIVWRATARTGRYLVREAEQGITDRVTIILDNDASHHAASQTTGAPSETFETAVRAVASLAKLHLHDGFVVSIESSSGPVTKSLRGQRLLVTMLDEMARAKMGTDPLSKALRRMLSDPRRDTHTILVTPHLDHGSAAMMKLMLDKGGSLTFVHVRAEDDESFDVQSSHRAAALGCEVIELQPGAPLESGFRRGIGAGIR